MAPSEVSAPSLHAGYWRQLLLLLLVVGSPLVFGSADSSVSERHEPLPRVATSRNAFGTRFACPPASILALLAHVALLLVAFALLLLVPVADDAKATGPYAALGFSSGDIGGSCKSAATAAVCAVEVADGGVDKAVEEPGDASTSTLESVERRRWPSFVSSWWLWCKARYERATVAAPPPSVEAERTGLMPSARAPDEPPKTYESVGVDTEDLLSPGRRGSIFANAPSPTSPPRRRATRVKAAESGGAEPLSTSFGGSETSFFSELTVASRTDTAHGTSELLTTWSPTERRSAPVSPRESAHALVVRDIERRASIKQRAVKRKERAVSDISYENLHDEEILVYEYLEFVRELLEGMVVKKVCQKSAKVVKRTFFITPDMTTVYWNKLGAKGWSSKKSSLDASRIDKVLRGFHGTANVEAKGSADKSALYVSVVCSDGKRLDLEAKDEAMRQRLYVGFSRLATEKRHEQQQTQEVASTAASSAPPLHRLVVPEAGEEEERDDEDEEKFPAPVIATTAGATGATATSTTELALERTDDPETRTETAAAAATEAEKVDT